MKKIIRNKEDSNKIIDYIGKFKLEEPIVIDIEKLYNNRN